MLYTKALSSYYYTRILFEFMTWTPISSFFLLDKCLIVIYEFGYSTIFDESVISQGVDNKSCVQKRKEPKEGLVFLLLKCCHMKSQGQTQVSFFNPFLFENNISKILNLLVLREQFKIRTRVQII